MVDTRDTSQRIERLMPLAEAVACIERLVEPVPARRVEISEAFGRTLATAVTIAGAHPQAAIALRDGIAVRAEATLDASAYAPAELAGAAVEVGDPMPAGADAVAPLDAVETRGTSFHAVALLAPGDGVLPAGADAAPGPLHCKVAKHLRASDLAALTILGVRHVEVREPRVRIMSARPQSDVVIAAVVGMLAQSVRTEGAVAITAPADCVGLEGALDHADADAVILVGGSGAGPRDYSVRELARRGRLVFHGVGLTPGETAGFGMIAERPVLVVPGRLDAAFAVWHLLGRRLLWRLAGHKRVERTESVVLSRKISSTLGLAELVPVARHGGDVAPLATGYLTAQSLVRADGFILVPADSEGFPAGARVEMRSLR
jgi:molybdopterin molybdotransferase